LVLALGFWMSVGLFRVSEPGAFLFWALNRFLLMGIWLAVPVLTADCISREKREGTLGLLFLTPLTGRDIALAKCAIHALRALTFWAAALPVLAVPLLMGGVAAGDIVTSVMADGRALVLALVAGLLASAWCRQANRAILLALILSLAFAVLLHGLEAFCVGRLSLTVFSGAFVGLPIGRRLPQQMVRSGMGAPSGALMEALLDAGLTLVVLLSAVLAVSLAAYCIERGWQDKERTARQQWWLETFCTPVFWRGLFRRRMRRMLERNPVGWLQQYSWSARLVKWSWCLGLVAVECFLLMTGYYGMVGAQSPLALVIPVGLVLSAAGSFRRERETGALELILVSPLRVGQVIGGRLRGIWGQFLPALLVVLLVWSAVENAWWYQQAWGVPPSGWVRYRAPIQLLATYLALPAVGLYFSLRSRYYLVGAALTVGVCLGLPRLAVMLLLVGMLGPSEAGALVVQAWASPFWPSAPWSSVWWLVTAAELLAGLLALLALRHALARRSFRALQGAG